MNLKLLIGLFLSISFFCSSFSLAQENSIEGIEANIDELYGIEKLVALNQLCEHYETQSSRKALKYGRKAVSLGENIFVATNTIDDQNEHYRLIESYLLLGKVLFYRNSFMEAKKNLLDAKNLSDQLNDQRYRDEIESYLAKIQALIDAGEVKENFISKGFANLELGDAINEKSQDIAINSEISKAENDTEKREFQAAIDHYEKAINLLRDKGDADQISILQLKISELLDSLNQHEKAQVFLGEAIAEKESIYQLDSSQSESIDDPVYDAYIEEKEDNLQQEKELLKDLAESYANEEDDSKSKEYYELYIMLAQKIEADSLNIVNERKIKEDELILLKQQKRIADLSVQAIENEKLEEVKLRNASILIAFLVLLATITILYFYIAKRKQHHRLSITYQDLNKTKGKLVKAEKRIRNLLGQQLSVEVASELLESKSDDLGEKRFVCIMFLDIRDFTPMAEKLKPEELIEFQNKTFGFMLDIVQSHNGTMNQLLGDGFMATFGAPKSTGNDCQNAFDAAEEILHELNEKIKQGVLKKTKIGIGLHAGNVVTGNVGNDSRKQYSVTGNAVIIASRIEQLNKKYKTQLIITDEVYSRLDHKPDLQQAMMEVQVKGRSKKVGIYRIR